MSGLRPQLPSPAPPMPFPRDEEARRAAEEMRRAGQARGRQTTVLTRLMSREPAQGYAPPRRTVVGGS